MADTFRSLFSFELQQAGESWSDVIACTVPRVLLDDPGSIRSGVQIWTKKYTYVVGGHTPYAGANVEYTVTRTLRRPPPKAHKGFFL